MQTFLRIVVTILVALVIFTGGAGAGFVVRDYWQNDQPPQTADRDLALYWEVWNRVREQFYGGVPTNTNTTYGAIKGSLATLNDPYTVFLEPEPAAQEKAQLEGQFGGIGAYVQQNEAGEIVLNPMPGQAADKAGLKKDDILLAIDDTKITPEMTIDAVVKLVRGEVGTEVVLLVKRAGVADPVKVPIVRAVIETPSVTWHVVDNAPKIGYIQLSAFTERSNAELLAALDELSQKKVESYIFDLRGNGGGLLEAAVDVASQFLRDGIVVKEKRQNEGERAYNVRGGGKALDQPLVVLVNGGTASASEIVAGALRDHHRATLIGEKTYGKGSVQLIYELSDRSRLHVTVAKWFTPNGSQIDRTGLKPDVEVLFTDDDHAKNRDPQLERAISFLQNKEYAKK